MITLKLANGLELSPDLTDLRERASRLPDTKFNLSLVRLVCSRGLRVSETVGLQTTGVRVELTRLHLR